MSTEEPGRRSEGEARGHLEVEEVVGYIHRTLPPEARSEVEAHLADCDACREEVVAVSRSMRAGRRSTRGRWLPVAIAAGMAGVLAVGLLTRAAEDGEEILFRFGPGALEQEPRIEVVEPEDGATVGRDAPRFVWRALESDGFYRFTLTDASGDVLLRRDTRDTVLVLDPEVPLRPGDGYFWYVDTLLETGQSATTNVVRFRVDPPEP